MTKFINTVTSAVSGFAIFVAGAILAVMGFAMVGILALFAFGAMGIALLASPFIKMKVQTLNVQESDETQTA